MQYVALMEYSSFNFGLLSMLDELSMEFDAPPVLSSKIIEKLQSGDLVKDVDFDRIYPPRIRALSEIQWTSVDVARQIASLVGKDSRARFIDIGSGVGKLCAILSLITKMEIHGIEQRKDLFEISQRAVQENHLERVFLTHGNVLDLDWSKYDIIYFYNPFQEHTHDGSEIGLIDKNIDLDRKYYMQYVCEVFRQVSHLKPGKKVITFHGYGGLMPPSMRLLNLYHIENGDLCLWEKVE